MKSSLLVLLLAAGLSAQHDHEAHTVAGQGDPNAGVSYLLGQASGTARNPASWQMPMKVTRIGAGTGAWDLMWMGQAYMVNTQQTGPRGDDGFYSANWGMLSAARPLGKGAVMLRTMLSLDPVTVRQRRYPLLFQSGETAFGRPIVDGQHPHDAVMELSVQYVRPVGENAMFTAYYAPVGDAALGPVAFPHRASAMDIPQAALSHHWLDSTHIATNLATVGLNYGQFRLEASGFHGAEPGENRWNFDMGAMDSWAVRGVYQPGPNWLVQTSVGRLTNPEASHEGDVWRSTASVQYTRGLWSSTLAWGRNYKVDEGRGSNALTAETLVPVTRNDWITGRLEWSQRDELFPGDDHHAGEAFDVAAFTAGYTRELPAVAALRTGIGFNFTGYAIDEGLKHVYGDQPVAASVFVRFRLWDRE